jgi:hypothetical protein
MAARRCQTCREIISPFDFFLNLPQGPVCSSCLVNRVCAMGELKVRARGPEKALDLDGIEALYPGLRPAAASTAVSAAASSAASDSASAAAPSPLSLPPLGRSPAAPTPAQTREAVLDRILSGEPVPARPAARIPGAPPAGVEPRTLREIHQSALEDEAEDAWAMPGFGVRHA